MGLGLVCHWIEERIHKNGNVSYYNLFENKTLRLGCYLGAKYSEERIYETYIHNARKVLQTLPILVQNGIKHYRLSSELIPLVDKVPTSLWDNEQLKSIYKRIGDYCRSQKMRITLHPAQFCVLNSHNENVIENAIRDLEYHAWLMDACEFDETPYYSINIHAGVRDNFVKLISQVNSLRPGIKRRLTFENCESVASVYDLKQVHDTTNVPIVFDSHHHTFNNGNLSMQAAYNLAISTWPSNIRPLQHIANTEKGLENGSFTERRKHSNFIHSIPECQLKAILSGDISLEVEAKMKNVAILQMSKEFDLKLI